MPVTPRHIHSTRPASPWPGSRYRAQHRWQLDLVAGLPDAALLLAELTAELTSAHHAGWWLVRPMRAGHLDAARASRRQRARPGPDVAPRGDAVAGTRRWRLRVVDEPPSPGLDVFDASVADGTPVLDWTGRTVVQVDGPEVAPGVLAELARQVAGTGLPRRRWGVAPARTGPNVDLVAAGSALRAHAVLDGVLVRTQEALTFQHAADGATTLLQAAAAYDRLALTARTAAAAGGRLVSADDGLLDIVYDPPPARGR